MLIFYLAIAVLTVPLGAGIAFVSQVEQRHFGNIFGLTAGAVLGVVLVMMMHLLYRGRICHNPCDVGWILPNFSDGTSHNTTDVIETERNIDSRWSVNLTVLGLSFHSLAGWSQFGSSQRKEELLGGAPCNLVY